MQKSEIRQFERTFFKSTLITLIVISVILGNWALSLDYYMNIHWKDMTDEVHTYKLYDHWINSITGRGAIDSLNLYINPETGDYFGANQNSKRAKRNFESWKLMCEHNPQEFTFSGFQKVQWQ